MSAEQPVDHAAEARKALAVILYENDEDTRVVPVSAEALAHATLALVDEQRTANLIAVVNMRWPDGSGLLGAPAIEAAVQQVRERLGLDA